MAKPSKSAKMAEKVLKFYSSKVAGHGKDEGLETRIMDLVGDLMHLADREGLDFDEIVGQARGHFEAERAGEF